MFIKVRVFCPECRCHNWFYHLNLFFFMSMVFQEGSFLEIKLKFSQFRPMATNTFQAILYAQIDLLLGEQRYAKNNHEYSLPLLFVNKRCFLSRLYGPRQANLVLIAYASSEGSGEPAHPRSLARTSAARSYRQWVKRNLQTESHIPGPSERLGMRS